MHRVPDSISFELHPSRRTRRNRRVREILIAFARRIYNETRGNLRGEPGGGGDGMNCSELRDHYELYAIGVAEEPERSEIRAHLDRQCAVCMQGVKRARAVDRKSTRLNSSHLGISY